MKIKVGRNSNDLEMWDNNGNKIEFWVRELDMKLRPNEATEVTMVIYVDEVEIDIDQDDVQVTPV